MTVRTSWSGTISFGLVSIPVGTTPVVRKEDLKFSQFLVTDEGEMHPVGRQEVDKVTGEVVTRAQISRGFKLPGYDEPVIVEDDEIEALAPEASKAIEIESFVDVKSIDLVYYDRHEFALPHKDGGAKPYALLVQALHDTDKVGVATTVRRGKQHRVLVREINGILALTFLNDFEEVKHPEELGIKQADVKPAELAMAINLVQSLSAEWDPTTLVDTQRQRVLEMISAKAAGQPAPVAVKGEAKAEVDDLMAALQASIQMNK